MQIRIAALTLIACAASALGHPPEYHASAEAEAVEQPARRPIREAVAQALPKPEITITIEGDRRVIRSNGIPGHRVGTFPNRGNPNTIAAQDHLYRVPISPVAADQRVTARPEFGIALNGVILDAGTAEFWSPRGRVFGGGSEWNYEALGGGIDLGLDQNNAHVQPGGKYHYHGVPVGLLEELIEDLRDDSDDEEEDEESDDGLTEEQIETMYLLGWAADGYPIYAPYGYTIAIDADSAIEQLQSSYTLRQGNRPAPPEGPGGRYDGTFTADYEYTPGAGDLDESNGRFGVTPEFPDGTYYYVLTEEFPSVPRSWRGQPDPSWQRRGGPGTRGGPGQRPASQPAGRRPPRRR